MQYERIQASKGMAPGDDLLPAGPPDLDSRVRAQDISAPTGMLISELGPTWPDLAAKYGNRPLRVSLPVVRRPRLTRAEKFVMQASAGMRHLRGGCRSLCVPDP